MSPSTRIHSWSFVYRRFSGTILFRSFVERGFHCHRIHRLVADHDLNGLARLRVGCREVAEADILADGRAGGATGDPAGGGAVELDLVAVAADAAAAHF